MGMSTAVIDFVGLGGGHPKGGGLNFHGFRSPGGGRGGGGLTWSNISANSGHMLNTSRSLFGGTKKKVTKNQKEKISYNGPFNRTLLRAQCKQEEKNPGT
jgi:hypothetical protein